jgi:hypothetical protein
MINDILNSEIENINTLVFNPTNLNNIFDIQKNIKTYGNLEKIDGYISAVFPEKHYTLLNQLVMKLSLLDKEEQSEIILTFFKNTSELKNKNINYIINVILLHKLNKQLDRYMLN